MKKLKIGIIGCNHMGSIHLRILRENFSEEVEIIGILNSRPETTAAKAAELNVPAFKNPDDFTPDSVDAAIISTSAAAHNLAIPLLKRGIPCLVEKPLAPTLDECNMIINAGLSGRSKIFVGHTENFNPAVIKLKEVLSSPIEKISGIRTSANNGNSTGITAVQELMIHDLAIVHSLLGTDIASAKIRKEDKYSWENHALVDLLYAGGAEVHLEAIRDAECPIERQMKIEDAAGNIFEIAFQDRRLTKNGKIIIEGGNSLYNELRNFIDGVKGTANPCVSGEEAREIVELCQKIESKIPKQG